LRARSTNDIIDLGERAGRASAPVRERREACLFVGCGDSGTLPVFVTLVARYAWRTRDRYDRGMTRIWLTVARPALSCALISGCSHAAQSAGTDASAAPDAARL
jgi:hypothetical protein